MIFNKEKSGDMSKRKQAKLGQNYEKRSNGLSKASMVIWFLVVIIISAVIGFFLGGLII